MESKKKAFYGWWIVAASFSITFAGMGIAMNSMSILFKPVCDALGFGRGDFTMTFAVGGVAIIISAPFIGKMFEKYDSRILVGVSSLMLAGSFALFSLCTKLWQFYLVSIIMGIGVAAGTFIACSVLITNWFVARRGLAMGIALSASGLGGLIYNPLGNWFLGLYGWQATYLFFAFSMAVLTIPASFIMRSRPQEMGLMPYGAETAATLQGGEVQGLSLKEALGSMAFWMLALMTFTSSVVLMGVQMHIVPYLGDIGHSSTFASGIMGLTLGVLILAKIVVGQVCDRFGLTKALLLAFSMMLIGMLFFYGAGAVWMAAAAAIFFSFGLTLQTILPPLITAKCVGLKHFGIVFGIVNMFMMMGSGLGAPLSGYFYDSFHSYIPAFHLYIGLTILAAIMGVMAISRAKYE
jgi:MFS family permease